MIKYFEETYNDIWQHALSEVDKECCGIIVDNKYLPLDNIASHSRSCFRLSGQATIKAYSQKNLQAVIHSHIDYPHLSEADMRCQHNMSVPWGIAFINKGQKGGIYFWGNLGSFQGFDGRPFIHGLYDCYSIVSDYYKFVLDVDLPFIARRYDWWEGNEDLLGANFKKAGFFEIRKGQGLLVGDVLLLKMRRSYFSHCMLYTGGETLLHHAQGRLSNYTSVYPWVSRADIIVRYKGSQC